MKTEERKAKIGERILITNAKPAAGFGQYYSNGDILHVTETDIYGEGNVGVYEFRGYIREDEYEVIVDENETEVDNMGIIEKMQAELSQTKDELEALKKRVDELETKQRVRKSFAEYRETKAKKKSLEESHEDLLRIFTEKKQKKRDEIIEKAKREVEEMRNDPTITEGLLATFIVDREKRTVTALLSSVSTGVVERQGVAKCHPDDCFNLHLGKVIALYKALGLKVPDEYLNAPQPTEVRVGDIIEYKGKRYMVSKAPLKNGQCGVNSIAVHNGKIIDDSRED